MKNILKISLSIVVGLTIGSVITAFLMNKFHRQYVAEMYSMELAGNALTALQLREGNVEIVSRSFENNLPEFVLIMSGDGELRNAKMADTALSSVKRFYACTKTEIPKSIVETLEKVPSMPCEGPN